MSAMIRPSLVLKMNMDERVYSDELVSEIKRSYSYVAPSLVSPHSASEGVLENKMRFAIKLNRPYWDKNEEAADELWRNVMPAWLRNMFSKVSSVVVAGNKVRAERGAEAVAYAWYELEFGENVLVAIKSAADFSLPGSAVDAVEQVRDLCARGVFDSCVACVSIPSRASFARRQREACETAPAQVGVSVPGNAEGLCCGNSEQAFFDIDYNVWGVEYLDGTVREFDALTEAFVA